MEPDDDSNDIKMILAVKSGGIHRKCLIFRCDDAFLVEDWQR